MENDSKGLEEWRMIVKDGGVENDSEGWGEWRMIAKDGGSGK